MEIKFETVDYQNKIKDTLEGLESSVPNSFATKPVEEVSISHLKELIIKVRKEMDAIACGKGTLTKDRIIPLKSRDPLVEFIKSPSSSTLDIFLIMVNADYGKAVSNEFKEWFKDAFTTKED